MNNTYYSSQIKSCKCGSSKEILVMDELDIFDTHLVMHIICKDCERKVSSNMHYDIDGENIYNPNDVMQNVIANWNGGKK